MQEFYPIAIFRRFLQSANWKLSLNGDFVEIDQNGTSRAVRYHAIENIAVGGIIFPAITIETENDLIYLPWLYYASARKAAAELREKAEAVLAEKFSGEADAIGAEIKTFYARDIYISNRAFNLWKDESLNLQKRITAALEMSRRPMFNRQKITNNTLRAWSSFRSLLTDNREELSARNKEYVRQEEAKFRAFFDAVEKSPLTEEQRRAAIIMEDRNLLVAAAGSGKTSAIVGKIGYILKKRYCADSQILVMAFNRKAAEELRERISRRLGNSAKNIAVNTFHKFGLSVIAKSKQSKPSVAEWTTNMGESAESSGEWEEMVNTIAAADPEFDGNFNALWMYFRYAVKPVYLFKNKNHYDQYLLSIRAKKSGGGDRDNWGVQTLKGERVRSLEEAVIANWLYQNGVDYKYENPYPHAPASGEFSQYCPDFYYPQIGAYHEHFALDQNGDPPHFFAPGYAEEARRKREIHAANKTVLIETTSAMFGNGDVFARLGEQLKKHKMVFISRPPSQISASVRQQFIKPLYGIIQSFVGHWKSGGFSEEELLVKVENLSGFHKHRTAAFLRVVFRVKKEYDKKLRANNEIDFEDMINEAAECLRGCRWRHPYQVVLVDEFQDISRSRVRLIRAVLEQNPDSLMFAVGDDWQSIYRFAGADVSVMANFARIFGETAENRLCKTFRSNQGIADAAANFVAKNPSQLQKQVEAEDDNAEGVVQVVNYFKKGEDEYFIQAQLRKMTDENRRAKVYILARYNYLKPDSFGEWKKEFGGKIDIEFSTVHRAKGREADYVFIVGMNSGENSFPCEIEDDPVLRLVMPENEKFEHAEERRLFYVALTRARYKVFLLSKKQSHSCFVDEILKENKNNVKENDYADGELGDSEILPRCPECGGYLTTRKGPYSDFWGCFNYPKCDYTRQKKPADNRRAYRRK